MKDKVGLMLQKDAEDLDYLKFNFGGRSFSEQSPLLRRKAIEARVDMIEDMHGAREQFNSQFKKARETRNKSFNYRGEGPY